MNINEIRTYIAKRQAVLTNQFMDKKLYLTGADLVPFFNNDYILKSLKKKFIKIYQNTPKKDR